MKTCCCGPALLAMLGSSLLGCEATPVPFGLGSPSSPGEGTTTIAAPDEVTADVDALHAKLKAVTPESRAACTEILPQGNESLGAALERALGKGATGTYCASPGALDRPLTVGRGVALILRPGKYRQSAPITLDCPLLPDGEHRIGAALIGTSAATTTIEQAAGVHGAQLRIAQSAESYLVTGLTLTRETAGTTPDDVGVETVGSSDWGYVQNVAISKQTTGLLLRNTGMTYVTGVSVTEGTGDGVVLMSMVEPDPAKMPASSTAAQFFLKDVVSARNGGTGIVVDPKNGHLCVENWERITTHGNGKGGLWSKDATTIYPGWAADGLRILNAKFVGDDGFGVRIDGGAHHQLSGVVASPRSGSALTLGPKVTSAILERVALTSSGAEALVDASLATVRSGVTVNGALAGLAERTPPLAPGGADLVSEGLTSSTCTEVAPGADLGAATAAAVAAKGPGWYCLRPGPIATRLTVPAGVTIVLAAGTYEQAAPIVLAGPKAAVLGTGAGVTWLRGSVTGAQIEVADGATGYVVRGLRLVRSSPSADGIGVRVGGDATGGVIENVFTFQQATGMYLRATDKSVVRNSYALNNTRDGVLLTNLGNPGRANRTNLDGLLVQFSGGAAARFAPTGTMEAGVLTGLLSFANDGGAVIEEATGTLEKVEILGSFFGNDGFTSSAEIELRSGSRHRVEATYIEAAGFKDIDKNLINTRASGIVLGPQVASFALKGSVLARTAWSAITSRAAQVSVESSVFTSAAAYASGRPEAAGIFVTEGNASVVGTTFYNDNVMAYGVYVAGGTATVAQVATAKSPSPTIASVTPIAFASGASSGPGQASAAPTVADIRAAYEAHLPGCYTDARAVSWLGTFASGGTMAGLVAALDAERVKGPLCHRIRVAYDQSLPGCYTDARGEYWEAWFGRGGAWGDFVSTLQGVRVSSPPPACLKL